MKWLTDLFKKIEWKKLFLKAKVELEKPKNKEKIHEKVEELNRKYFKEQDDQW